MEFLWELHEEADKFANGYKLSEVPKSIGHFFNKRFNSWLNKEKKNDDFETKLWRKQLFQWFIKYEESDCGCEDLYKLSSFEKRVSTLDACSNLEVPQGGKGGDFPQDTLIQMSMQLISWSIQCSIILIISKATNGTSSRKEVPGLRVLYRGQSHRVRNCPSTPPSESMTVSEDANKCCF